MKNNKKRILLFGILAFTVFLIIVRLVMSSLNNNGKNEEYKKYIADITVITRSNNKTELINISVKDDGANANIISSNVVNPSYILGSNLYYLKDNTYYICSRNKTYRDFYPLVNSIKDLDRLRDDGENTYYSKVIGAQELNDILDSLFFSKKTRNPKVVEITKTGNSVIGFKVSLNDIDGYDNIDIIASFEEIDESFEVDSYIVLGQDDNFGSSYRYENTKENIHEIIK